MGKKAATILALGRQDDLHIALKTGRISAAIYSPPRNLMLYRDGFHITGSGFRLQLY